MNATNQTPKTFEEFIEIDDCPIDIDLWRTRSGFILKDEMQKIVNFIGKHFWNAAAEATRTEYKDKVKAMQAEIDKRDEQVKKIKADLESVVEFFSETLNKSRDIDLGEWIEFFQLKIKELNQRGEDE